VSNGLEHLPIDFELFLPEEWANDPVRRREAQIPDSVQFKTKVDLALDTIERAVADKVPGDIVLADAAYGRSSKFRDTVRLLGFDYAVGVDATTKVVVLGPGDPHEAMLSGARATEGLTVALDAAREPARRTAWAIALDIFTNAPGELPSPDVLFADAVTSGRQAAADHLRASPRHPRDCPICASMSAVRDAMVTRFILHTSEIASRLAVMAARHAGWQIAYLLRELPQLDPWRPLLDLWRLGACPLGSTGEAFVVFAPEAQN
jgi:DDE superfamily endonuclease